MLKSQGGSLFGVAGCYWMHIGCLLKLKDVHECSRMFTDFECSQILATDPTCNHMSFLRATEPNDSICFIHWMVGDITKPNIAEQKGAHFIFRAKVRRLLFCQKFHHVPRTLNFLRDHLRTRGQPTSMPHITRQPSMLFKLYFRGHRPADTPVAHFFP